MNYCVFLIIYNFFHWHVYALKGTITFDISYLLCAFNPLNKKKKEGDHLVLKHHPHTHHLYRI